MKISFQCARKFFAEVNRQIDSEHVKYDVVTNYGKLMEIVGRAEG
jgi:type III restriction enzyme